MGENLFLSLVLIVAGILVGIVVMTIVSKVGLNKSQREAKLIVKEAEAKAESVVKEAVLDGKTQAHELKIEAEKEIKEKKQEVADSANQLLRREDNLNFRDEAISEKEVQLDKKNEQLTAKMSSLETKEKELEKKIEVQEVELERVASMSSSEAKKELFDLVEKKMEKETVSYMKEKEDEARLRADETAKNIIASAIQTMAQDEAADRTVSVVSLPSEEMKGRIIGREGRNIKAIEAATGVDLIIDDTPETITVSCFNPIRREIARLSLETLISDGRIQPGRIEEVVNKVTRDMNTQIMKVGEETIFKLGIGKMDRELIELVGILRYRYSYGQNALQHSMEVARLCGIMAGELGLNVQLAKRAGLLHDIGKAIDIEVEGTHTELGYKVCKKHGESEVVLNGIMSHHGQEEPRFLIANLVCAADALSAARPGARHEGLQSYVNRLEELEKLAKSFDGVEETFAIQAGREVRVMVMPDTIDDLGAYKLAREIREKIESDLTYPGQIKVTVIREVRAGEVAK